MWENGPEGSVVIKKGPKADDWGWSNGSLIDLGDATWYGEGYFERHLSGSGSAEIAWSGEGADLYNSEARAILELNDDDRMVVIDDGLYELRITTYGYGNGGTGTYYAQTDVLIADPETALGMAYVDLSGVTGQKLSNEGQPTRTLVPLRAGTELKVMRHAIWQAGSIPSGTNFECDVYLVPLFFISH